MSPIRPEDKREPERKCCNRHHYTCAASFDDDHPWRCCANCPCYPDRPEWVL